VKGHIRERSHGRFAIILDVHDPTTGKRKRKWHSFKGTKRAARVECARLRTEQDHRSAVHGTMARKHKGQCRAAHA
jgi:hypothetical protein